MTVAALIWGYIWGMYRPQYDDVMWGGCPVYIVHLQQLWGHASGGSDGVAEKRSKAV